MKSALVHDWLVNSGGAEKVLEALFEIVPSPIYTLFYVKSALDKKKYQKAEIYASFLQRFPAIKKSYRALLPLFPAAISSFDLSKYDLIISSSHCAAKGVKKGPGKYHICYCHTPMRYAWDLGKDYGFEKGLKKRLFQSLMRRMREWDKKNAENVDLFIANSKFVAKRIEQFYHKPSIVIYPPVNVENIPFSAVKETFYLAAARLVPYKKILFLVEAFSKMPQRKLLVIGDGPEMRKIKKCAKKNVEILGAVSDKVLHHCLKNAKAFLHAATEDFGILPVEAQAAGTPVIALGRGGLLETVISGKTGIFFNEHTFFELERALDAFENSATAFIPENIRAHAEQFSEERFKEAFKTLVERYCR